MKEHFTNLTLFFLSTYLISLAQWASIQKHEITKTKNLIGKKTTNSTRIKAAVSHRFLRPRVSWVRSGTCISIDLSSPSLNFSPPRFHHVHRLSLSTPKGFKMCFWFLYGIALAHYTSPLSSSSYSTRETQGLER